MEEARNAERENEEAATAKAKRDRLARVAADNEKSSCRAGRTGIAPSFNLIQGDAMQCNSIRFNST